MKENSLKVLVIVLTILVLGMGGFILYDKVLSDSKDSNKNLDCPKCEKCDNNSLNTNSSYGEKIASFKKVTLTNENQVVTIGSKEYKVRIDEFNKLFIDDVAVKNSEQKNIVVNNAYLTDKFIFFTSFAQMGEGIVFAQNEETQININSNQFSMDDFKLVDGYLHATGHLLASFDDFTNNNVVVKYFIDTFEKPNLVVIPAQ